MIGLSGSKGKRKKTETKMTTSEVKYILWIFFIYPRSSLTTKDNQSSLTNKRLLTCWRESQSKSRERHETYPIAKADWAWFDRTHFNNHINGSALLIVHAARTSMSIYLHVPKYLSSVFSRCPPLKSFLTGLKFPLGPTEKVPES